MKKKILTILTCGLLSVSMTVGAAMPCTVYADEWDDWDDYDYLWYDSNDDFETMLVVGEMLDEEARKIEAKKKKQKKERKKLERERRELEEQKAKSVRVNGLLVSTNALNLAVGQTTQVGVQVVPENAVNRGVTLYSSNPAVATVDIYANITGVAPGTAVITAVTNENGFTQQIVVNVGGAPIVQQ